MRNVVISKKFLRTHKIMVMHSNERGECCPRTLVDRKWKHFNNAVDVVELLPDPIDQVPNIRYLRVQHTFQLDDVPRTLDPVEAEGKFRQHDAVVTVMMKLPAQGFA